MAHGEVKGEAKKARETAFRLRRMNYPVELIAEIVDVPIARIEAWFSAEQMHNNFD